MSDQDTSNAEYNAAYEAEMARLNAEAGAVETPTPPTTPTEKTDPPAAPAATTPPAAGTEAPATPPAAPAPGSEAERLAKLEERLASTEKALNDTKSWASKNAAELKRLQKEREAAERAAKRPAVLADNPGLEEAIQYVAGTPAAGAKPAHDPDAWANTVGTALPDLDALLEKSPELRAKAEAKAQELGAAWNDPIVAIRELGALQLEHVRNGVATAAAAQARADFENGKKKQTAMQVPGGGGGNSRPAAPSGAEAVWAMSDAEFNAMRNKTLGY